MIDWLVAVVAPLNQAAVALHHGADKQGLHAERQEHSTEERDRQLAYAFPPDSQMLSVRVPRIVSIRNQCHISNPRKGGAMKWS